MLEHRVELEGSHKKALAGVALSAPNLKEEIVVTLELPRNEETPRIAGLPKRHEDFAKQHGASASNMEFIANFVKAHGLTVVEASQAKRTIKVKGALESILQVFETKLSRAKLGRDEFRHREGPIYIPRELNGRVISVLGLDNRPQAKPHFRMRETKAVGPAPLTPIQVAQAYQFRGGDGEGATIAILELGGGYDPADIATYYKQLGIATAPKVTSVAVDGADNTPNVSDADGEVALDIDVIGAIAPAAQLLVYFSPNTDQGFSDALAEAVHANPTPTAISISWGGPETNWTQQGMQSLGRYLEDAAQLGIPVFVAAGDNGSTDGTGTLATDFPASHPSATACGGTRIDVSNGRIVGESVWNDQGAGTGGGISTSFAIPDYQSGAGVPAAPNAFRGRGVPDVAGDADPASGYEIYMRGQSNVVGGTSAVAPLWSALIARIAGSKQIGFINPTLYANSSAFNDVVSGTNDVGDGRGMYPAGRGWDPCTGMGSPIGTQIATILSQVIAANPAYMA